LLSHKSSPIQKAVDLASKLSFTPEGWRTDWDRRFFTSKSWTETNRNASKRRKRLQEIEAEREAEAEKIA